MILFILYVNACENFFLEKLMENVFFSKKLLINC